MTLSLRSRMWIMAACVAPALASAADAVDTPAAGEPEPIEEIVVTVSKRSESLQTVMGTVSAFSGETLKQNNVRDFRALAGLIPGMIVQRQEAGADEVAIRGISRTRDGPSPVAFHTNDVFLAMRGEPYYDLAAIEVLRGPSGTVFGRNATAGALNVKWRAPEAQWGAGGDYRYTGLSEQQLRAWVNVPFLGEDDRRLLGRVAVASRRSDGTLDNLLVSDSEDPGNVEEQFVRVFLSSEPRDDLRLGLRVIRYESTPDGTPAVFSPSEETRVSGVLEGLGASPLPRDLREVRSLAHERFGSGFDRFTRVDGDVAWSLQELPLLGDMDVVLVGGEQRRDYRTVYDLDGTEEPILDGQSDYEDDLRRTAELRLLSRNNNGVEWLAGLFWYRQTLDTESREVLTRDFFTVPGLPDFVGDVSVSTVADSALDESQAVFGNLELDLQELFGLPHVVLTTGLRRSRDQFEQNIASNDVFVTLPFLPDPLHVISQRDLDKFADFEETTGEIGARWFLEERGMLYLKFARGYKPGLAQNVVIGTEVIQNPVDAELLDAWEAGWKTALFDQTLQLNLAAFHYDYQNLQVSQISVGGVLTQNAAEATIRGVELDAQWAPTPALSVQGALAWTDATYDEYCGTDSARVASGIDPGCTAANPFDFSGERLTAAPEYSASLLASYTVELGALGTLTPSLRSSWTDWLDRRGLGNPIDRVDAYSSSDVRLTWRSPQERWTVEGFVENIEDHDDVFLVAFSPISQSRRETYSMSGEALPRIFGVSVEMRLE